MKKKIISIDFDGTIADESNYPEIGKEIKDAIRTIKDLHNAGHTLILNTLREDIALEIAIAWLYYNGISKCFECFNENCQILIKKWNCDPRKIAADYIIDDRAIGWNGWGVVRKFFELGE